MADDFDGNGGATETGHTLTASATLKGSRRTTGLTTSSASSWTPTPGGDAGGERYPEVEEAIDRRVDGALLVNYIGHGGERWAHERVLNVHHRPGQPRPDAVLHGDLRAGRFDDPELETAGEMMVMNPNGGARP